MNAEKVDNNNKVFVKAKQIICPQCKEKIRMNIKDYKINLFDCKNNHNFTILLNEFNNKIDISNIQCNNCNINKSKTNEFYRCLSCNINLCPTCKNNHNKEHDIINYELKDFICNIHNQSYIKYCKECKMNICLDCINQHKNHNLINFEDIIPDKSKINKMKEDIDKLNEYINEIINKLKIVKENMEIYYNIYKDMFDNFKYKNYEILQNLNDINFSINLIIFLPASDD